MLAQFKGDYAITDFVYRKYTQAVHGGWAIVHIEETDQGHHVTREQALVARTCVEALQRGEPHVCRGLPWVMQASGVGHDWDCWFREWSRDGRTAPRKAWCPTPSWVQPFPTEGGTTCWSVHGLALIGEGADESAMPPAARAGRALSVEGDSGGVVKSGGKGIGDALARHRIGAADRGRHANGVNFPPRSPISTGGQRPIHGLPSASGGARNIVRGDGRGAGREVSRGREGGRGGGRGHGVGLPAVVRDHASRGGGGTAPPTGTCPDRHTSIPEALAACHHEGLPKCTGVVMPGGAERNRDRARCGSAIYIRRSGPFLAYEGKWQGSRVWLPLSGADAAPCERLVTLSATLGPASPTDGAIADPSAHAPPMRPPLASGWDPSSVLKVGAGYRTSSRTASQLAKLAARHQREMSLAVAAVRGLPVNMDDAGANSSNAKTLVEHSAPRPPPLALPTAFGDRRLSQLRPSVARRLRFPSSAVPLPRIFVYNTSYTRLMDKFFSERSEEEAMNWAFGKPLGDGYHATDTWALAGILMYRLYYQRPQMRVSDPAAADLFVIPMLPRRPPYGTAAKYGDNFEFETRDVCDHLWDSRLEHVYPHLTEHTASQHVVLAVDYTTIGAFCAIRSDQRYAGRKPRSAALLRRMTWLMHEEFGPPAQGGAPHPFYASVPTMGGVLVNVPFPSAVHSREALQRHAELQRPYLLSFAGSLKGSPTGKAIRAAIDTQCHAAGEPSCKLHKFAPGADLGGSSILSAFRLMGHSTFCAEPGGHNLIRKGVVRHRLDSKSLPLLTTPC